MKVKVYTLIGIIFISIILTLNLITEDRMVVYRLRMNNTPALQYEPMVGNNTAKWNTEFQYLYESPVPESFDWRRYKKVHGNDIVIIHSSKDEERLTVYSNQMPDEDFFLPGYRIGPTL